MHSKVTRPNPCKSIAAACLLFQWLKNWLFSAHTQMGLQKRFQNWCPWHLYASTQVPALLSVLYVYVLPQMMSHRFLNTVIRDIKRSSSVPCSQSSVNHALIILDRYFTNFFSAFSRNRSYTISQSISVFHLFFFTEKLTKNLFLIHIAAAQVHYYLSCLPQR